MSNKLLDNLKQLSEQSKTTLDRELSLQELREALADLNENKAPGLTDSAKNSTKRSVKTLAQSF